MTHYIYTHAQSQHILNIIDSRGVKRLKMYDLINEFDKLHIYKATRVLSKEQINRILELKQTMILDKDPMRSSWHYTKKELSLASLILSICNNNKVSYLFGLYQILSKSRANALLKKLVS